jgi:hypothetical protein
MKTFFTALLCFAAFSLFGQSPENMTLEIIVSQNFEGDINPEDTMQNFPTGFDQVWVNYDADNKPGLCVQPPTPTPKGWYREGDFGILDTAGGVSNYAFTSCSYLNSANPQNNNWLILSPIHILDDAYWLSWRSLSYYGPDFMDGYKVLVSENSNLPSSGDFEDVLFQAAQTIASPQNGSLDVGDYVFSPGYIHANGYTDTAYFFIDYENGLPFYRGKLEPHGVSLAAYANKTIYIAFLHDSFDDFQIQIDDITVVRQTTAAPSIHNTLDFNILPNPARDFARAIWRFYSPQAAQFRLSDAAGKTIWEQNFDARSDHQIPLDLRHLPPGLYHCSLSTASGQAHKRLVKL